MAADQSLASLNSFAFLNFIIENIENDLFKATDTAIQTLVLPT